MATSVPLGATRTFTLPDGLALTVTEFGAERAELATHAAVTAPHAVTAPRTATLVIHGGSGPGTIAGFAAALAERPNHPYVLLPTHPGYDGTPRPERTDSVADLAVAYLDLLDALDLHEVTVVGSSLGSWIATEMGLRDNHRRIAALVLLSAVGIEPEPPLRLANPAELGPARTAELAFHRPELRPDRTALSAAELAALAANARTGSLYARDLLGGDPKLRGRLHRVTVPVLVLAGEQDGLVPLAYERTLAASFPHAAFQPIPEAGHFPYLEQPKAVLAAIDEFVRS